MDTIEFAHIIFETRFGWMALVGSAKNGLVHVVLPQRSAGAALRLIGEYKKRSILNAALFGDLPKRLGEYFEGKAVSFNVRLDLRDAGFFKRNVLQVTGTIHYGETRSYGWVAQRIGRPMASRAVGQALASNPLPIVVPCHRVVGSSGKLVGFSAGLEMKRRLLEMEARGLSRSVFNISDGGRGAG